MPTRSRSFQYREAALPHIFGLQGVCGLGITVTDATANNGESACRAVEGVSELDSLI